MMNKLKLSHKFLLPVILGGFLILISFLAGLYVIKAKNTREAGLNTASALASQIKSMRSFYTEEIASRAKASGMTLNYDFAEQDSTLPLPATFTHALGERIAAGLQCESTLEGECRRHGLAAQRTRRERAHHQDTYRQDGHRREKTHRVRGPYHGVFHGCMESS